MPLTSYRQLLCLIKVESIKLAQVGLRDFLANTRVRKLKRERDDNKKVFCDKISNSAGHK